MQERLTQQSIEHALFIVYGLIILYIAWAVIFGFPLEKLNPHTFTAYLSISITMLTAFSVIVCTYSFIFFLQEGQYADLILSMAILNLSIDAFLSMITHVNSPFVRFVEVSVIKSDTILFIGAGLLTVALFLGTILDEKQLSTRVNRLTLLIFGAFFPLLTIVVTLSEYQVVMLSFSQGVLVSLSYIISAGLAGLLIVSIICALVRWKDRKTIMQTARLLSSSLILSFLFLRTFQTSVYQSIELLSINSAVAGVALFALVLIAISIVEPHRALTEMVENRTKELEMSKREIEFYLFMWGHDVGNTLQGIATYLELLPRMVAFDDPTTHMHRTATELTDKATDIVRLVNQLTQIKAKERSEFKEIDMNRIVGNAFDVVASKADVSHMELKFEPLGSQIFVFADELLHQAITNLIYNRCEFNKSEEPFVSVHVNLVDAIATVTVVDNGPPLPSDVRASLFGEFVPSTTSMGLRLFIVKQLVTRYGGLMSYFRDERTGENTFSVAFQRIKFSNIDETPIVKASTIERNGG